MADDVLVMYLGRPVEYGASEAIFADPRHPYTRALLVGDADRRSDAPERAHQTRWRDCRRRSSRRAAAPFHPRCPLAFERCLVERPDMEEKGDVSVACWAVDAAGRVVRAPSDHVAPSV